MMQGRGDRPGTGTSERKGRTMTMHIEQADQQSYVIYDAIGRPIGRVVQPKHEPAVGPGQETVLLLRAG